MTWAWIIAAIIVLMSAMSIAQVLRRILLLFSLAFAALCLLHFQTHPTEATAALATLGGGFALMSPLRRILMRLPF